MPLCEERICYSLCLRTDGYKGRAMNLQQLRYVRETIRRGTEPHRGGGRLHTSQPGVSRQIRQLEDELGVDIFVRRGKAVDRADRAGRALAQIVGAGPGGERRTCAAAAAEFHDQDAGALTIATRIPRRATRCPRVVAEFKRRYPRVHLSLLQGSPTADRRDGARGHGRRRRSRPRRSANYPRPDRVARLSRGSTRVIVPAGHPLSRRAGSRSRRSPAIR